MLALLFSIVLKICEAIVKFFSYVIIKLKLMLPFSYALIGLVTNLIWRYLENDTYRTLFNIGLVLCCAYSVYALFRAITKPYATDSKHKNRKNEKYERPNKTYEPERIHYESSQQVPVSNDYFEVPLVFEVAQNPNFMMYEYKNRYELFKKVDNGKLQYVRTDYKNVR